MKTHFVGTTIATLALLSLIESPVLAERTAPELPLRILVTIDDESAGKSANKPYPSKNYRLRSRYQVSAAARRAASAIAAEYDIKAVDDWPIESLGVYCIVYDATLAESLPDLLLQLRRDSRVESAQEMHRFESMALPSVQYNDSYAKYQYGLESMNVSDAHKFADGKGVKIAVIDSGVDLRHEDLRRSKIRSRDFVPSDRGRSSTAHGTAVISLIVARPNNGKGIVGVAPAAELTALRACWSSNESETAQCDSFTLAKALDFLVISPPDLINLSIAGPNDPLLGRLIDKALQNGTIIVAARPNSASAENAYPAEHPGVLAVSAAPLAYHAGIVPTDTILAPGEQIMVALPDDVYDFRSGSSLAAANASGVIALLLERVTGLDSTRIAEVLRKSRFADGQDTEMINACRALAEIEIAIACR